MPQTPHIEKHFTGSEWVRNIVIGMSDGLTVPFALAAGLSGAVNNSAIIVTAGVAEMAAGAIAMGLGGFLAARSDTEHYESEKRREEREIVEKTEAEIQEVVDIVREFGLSEKESKSFAEALRQKPSAWVNFMMRLELGLEKPDPKRAPISALTIGGAYIVGGAIPLLPYVFVSATQPALALSVVLTLIALVIFGAFKGYFTGTPPARSAAQTLLIGGLAAATAFLVARLIA